MDMDSIVSSAISSLAGQNTGSAAGLTTGTAVGLTMLKKAMDTQAQSVTALLNAIPQPGAANLPANLGQNVNTAA